MPTIETFANCRAENVTNVIVHHPEKGYLEWPAGSMDAAPRFTPYEDLAYFGTVDMVEAAARRSFPETEWPMLEAIPVEVAY